METTMIPTALPATLLTITLGAAPAGGAPQGEYPTLWKLATEAFRARDAERASELLGEVVERTPGRAEAWVGLSRAHEWAGRLDAAITAGERAQELGWLGGGRLAYRLARLHAQAGHTESALAQLERALAERFEDRPEIASDEAFAAMRDHAHFRRLAGIPPAAEATRVERWRFDLDYLVEEAQRMHADPGRPAFEAPFTSEAATLRKAIPELTDDEIFLRMMRLLAILDDGHTVIYGPAEDSPIDLDQRVLPFKMYWFPEGLYVTDGVEAWAGRAGHRIVRFGDLDAEEVLRRMAAYRRVDNPMTWRWMGPQFTSADSPSCRRWASPGTPGRCRSLSKHRTGRSIASPSRGASTASGASSGPPPRRPATHRSGCRTSTPTIG